MQISVSVYINTTESTYKNDLYSFLINNGSVIANMHDYNIHMKDFENPYSLFNFSQLISISSVSTNINKYVYLPLSLNCIFSDNGIILSDYSSFEYLEPQLIYSDYNYLLNELAFQEDYDLSQKIKELFPNNNFIDSIYINNTSISLSDSEYYGYLIKETPVILANYYSYWKSHSQEDFYNSFDIKHLCTLNLVLSNRKISTYRSYIKLHEVISNLGGVFQVLTIVALSLYIYYPKFLFKQYLVNKYFDTIIEDFDKSKDSSEFGSSYVSRKPTNLSFMNKNLSMSNNNLLSYGNNYNNDSTGNQYKSHKPSNISNNHDSKRDNIEIISDKSDNDSLNYKKEIISNRSSNDNSVKSSNLITIIK